RRLRLDALETMMRSDRPPGPANRLPPVARPSRQNTGTISRDGDRAEGLNGRAEMWKKRLHKPFTRFHCCLYITRGSRRASSNTLFPFLSHDPGQPEALAAMDAAPRGGVRSQSAAPRASLAESRARLPRRGENAGAPATLVAS